MIIENRKLERKILLFVIITILIIPLATAEGIPLPTPGGCGLVQLNITNFCYKIVNEKIVFEITLKNSGIDSPLAIGLITSMQGISNTPNKNQILKLWKEEQAWNQESEDTYNYFKDDKSLKLVYSTESTKSPNEEYNFSSIYILPSRRRSYDDFCSGLAVKPNKVTDCTTGKQIWPQKSIFNKINLNLIYTFFGIIIILIIIYLFIKNPKKRKKKLIELPEKDISPIPKNITTAVSIKNFSVKYRNINILDNVSLETKRGDLVCLLGPSGTGKSTIIEALMGRKIPTNGAIKIFDQNIKNKKTYDHIGFVPQSPELYMNQTVEENLLSSATKWGIKNPENEIKKVLSTTGLLNRKNLKASKLSGGQIKLLSLSMELIRNPELLILDEPTTGLDPNTRNNIITILSRLVTDKKKTVLFTTHYMEDAEECDEVIIIAQGRVVAQGSPMRLKKRLPSGGKIVNVVLDNVTNDLLREIQNLPEVEEVISEGRDIKIITKKPSVIKLAQKIEELGGIINKTEITNATMEEVFVYYTKKEQ